MQSWDALLGPFLQRRPVGGDRLLQPRRAALALAECPERDAEVLLRLAHSSGTRARVCSPAPPGRRRPPPPAAPCRSRACRVSGARYRGYSASGPIAAARARECVLPAPPGRRRPPPPAAPSRSRASPSVQSALPRFFCVMAHCERHALAGAFLQRRPVGRDRLLQPRRPALALAERLERVAEVLLRLGPLRAARARECVLPAPPGRPRPPPPAVPFRSRARRASGARYRGSSASGPIASGTRARVRSSSAAR